MEVFDPVAIIGFGEAGMAFACGLGGTIRAYDRLGIDAKRGDHARASVLGTASNAEAVAGARIVLSLVTADQAVAAARETAGAIAREALYLDCNSVAPGTKAEAAHAIEAVGAHYVDVAVMAPVEPLRLAVPLLVAGTKAEAGREALKALGFTDVTVVGEEVGQAAAIKMIRSVMIKGIEALAAELAAAADAAGVRAAVMASLDASWKRDLGWSARIDGALERMVQHGMRRASEMDEVAVTLASLGVDNRMARATAATQRAGARGSAQQGQAA